MRSPRLRSRARRGVFAALVVSMAGVFWVQNPETAAGYALLTGAACLPCALWIRAGMPGIPVWPSVAALSWLYYAVPMLRDHLAQTLYTPAEIFSLAATVSIFLAAGTLAWRALFHRVPRDSGPAARGLLKSSQMSAVIFAGLGLGLLFYTFLGFWFSLGSYFGVARSLMMNACIIACYLLGHARGIGVLRGNQWALAVILLIANVGLTWSSLFLVTGMIELLAALTAYVLTVKRLPWIALAIGCLVVTILHAGKAETRQQNSGRDTVSAAPALLAEWFGAGLATLANGDNVPMAIDRASLFRLLLSVQRLAPQSVSFLNGESYSLLPGMLIPRFVAPDKAVSQGAMIMLNVRFGFQTEEATQSTAIGWGLIAEAFANFGLAGVFGMGIVAGTIAGCFTRCSCGASPVSPGAIVGIVGLVTMMNLEGDFAGLLASLWQSLISVAVLSSVVRLFQAAPSLVDAASVPDRVKTLATALTARGESETPIADARGSAGSISYGAAIVRERHLPRAATGARP